MPDPFEKTAEEKDLNSNEQELQKVSDDVSETKNEIIKSKVSEIVYEAMRLVSLINFGIDARNKENNEKIVNYIVSGDIKTHKDAEIDQYINNLSSDTFGWKLKYLSNNRNLSLEKNLRTIHDIEEKTRGPSQRLKTLNKTSNTKKGKESSLISKGLDGVSKGWEWLKGKILGLVSGFVDLSDVPEKIGGVFGDMLSRAEKYIGKSYTRGSMDCSMFLSKIFCAGQGIAERRIGTSTTFSNYPKVRKEDIRCGDVIYQAKPAHVELVVSKPFIENGKTYVVTIGSSSDTNRVDPMFDASGKVIVGRNGVGYRRRQIAPNPRHPYTFHRPPYDQWASNRKA